MSADSPVEPQGPVAADAVAPGPQRLVALDAFRGAIMLLMASNGFGLKEVAKSFPASKVWEKIGLQVDHTVWAGCTLWDLIQPSFMFMVGVALPWSVANRQARGQSSPRMFAHALARAALLVLLAVFLTSAWSKSTEWVFTNVLAQIGLGYPLLFLLYWTKPRMQWIAAFGILAVYWLAFATHPLPASSVDGSPPAEFAAHWQKGANFAASFDLWFLNVFPRESPFTQNQGGYQTLNFVPSLATMLFGMIAGRLLRSTLSLPEKLTRLLLAGAAGILLGVAIQRAGWCPIVKRLWTPSWVLFSGGLVTLLLATFIALIEWGGWKRWTFPLVVAGLNPITLYCMWQLMDGFVRETIKTHLGRGVFESAGATYAPILERASVLLVFWLILLWMYRKKIFLRI